jgi:IMP cyclohydrolase
MTQLTTITAYLAGRPYPGRGLMLSRSHDAITVSVFLTGRSHASQARRLVQGSGTLEVVPTDGAADDPLRHYFAIVTQGERLVAGNGRQVSDIAASECGPATAEEEFRRLTFEPDPPIFTPRLSAVVDLSGSPLALLGIAGHGTSGETTHQLRQVHELAPGDAWLLHTYDGNVDSPGSRGFIVQLHGDATGSAGASDIWSALSPEYRVAVGSVTAPLGKSWGDGKWYTQHRS